MLLHLVSKNLEEQVQHRAEQLEQQNLQLQQENGTLCKEIEELEDAEVRVLTDEQEKDKRISQLEKDISVLHGQISCFGDMTMQDISSFCTRNHLSPSGSTD